MDNCSGSSTLKDSNQCDPKSNKSELMQGLLHSAQVWEQYPQRVTAIEPSAAMIKLATDLQRAQQASNSSSTCSIQWHHQLHPSMLPTKKSRAQQTGRHTYDLVVASYVLTEMQSDAARQQAIDMLWRQTKDVLVLLEPGTPSGSAYVRHARSQVCLLQPCF